MSTLRVVWSPHYEVDIGAHVFPTQKYRLVRERLLRQDVLDGRDFVEAEPAHPEDLHRVHTREYLRKIEDDDLSMSERLVLEVPFTPALRTASVLCCGGTLRTARIALDDGVSVHLGGGFHHAFADHGEGFCLLNDVAVAAAALLAEGSVERVLIVDLDVHHGNGTAAIFSHRKDVFTFSMHQDRNYPAHKPASDLDVGLPDGLGDGTYLDALQSNLEFILSSQRPEVVIYLAGADPYREDQLGGLRLTLDGLSRRDAYVIGAARDAGAAVAVVLAGGYAFHQADTVSIHTETVRRALEALGDPRSRSRA
jgi:acetoin utilization deacetylase AcuC-like enzyme